MSKDSRRRFDVLVIGGGPAGMAAAVRAAECGVEVGIVDDNATLGGQIWRGESEDGDEPGRHPMDVKCCGQPASRSFAGREFFTSRKRECYWRREMTISANCDTGI